jgi:TRAP-type C4-dicarboxylate transport system permease small subunit
MKSTLNWVYGTLAFIGVAIVLMIAIQVYRKLRKK